MQCSACHEDLPPAWANLGAHPHCVSFDDPWDTDPLAARIKSEMINIIQWSERESPRSQQVEIGPSELGDLCDRRIGYRIAGIPHINTETDPWAAFVGSAIHSRLADGINRWVQATGDQAWYPEKPVDISSLVPGTTDVYREDIACVIDHKGASLDGIKKIQRSEPPHRHQVQVQCYGLGCEQLGLPVRKVALAYYPRNGWLREIYVWTADYDRSVAERALARLHEIATQVVALDVLNMSHRWEDVTAVPSNDCGFCPWYDPDRDLERGASDKGCPGR